MRLTTLCLVLLLLAPTLAVRAAELKELWSHLSAGAMLCVDAGDVDGDGKSEVVAGSEDKHLYILNSDGTVKQAVPQTAPVKQLLITDLDGDGKQDLVSISYGLNVWALPDRILWGTQDPVDTFAVGKLLDGPGKQIVASSRSVLRAYGADGRALWVQCAPNGAHTIRLADLDGDHLDDVICVGKTLQAIKSDGTILWERKAGDKQGYGFCDEALAVDDINGDGKPEIIAATNDQLLCFDAKGQPLWTGEGAARVMRIATGDMDGDGQKQLALGSTMFDVRVHDNKGAIRFHVNVGSWTEAVDFADLNGDHKDELLIGSQGMDSKVYAVGVDGAPLWSNVIGSKITALKAADLNGDGKRECLVASNDLRCLDGNGKVLWKFGAGGRTTVTMADLRGDGKREVIAGAAGVQAYDLSGAPLWSLDTPYVWTLTPGDVDGDKRDEILVTCYSGRAFVIDDDGKLLRRLSIPWIRAKGLMARLDGSNQSQWVIDSDQQLHGFDLPGSLWDVGAVNPAAKEPRDQSENLFSLAAADVNGDGRDEIFCGGFLSLFLFSPEGRQLWCVPSGERGQIGCVGSGDLNGDGKPELLAQVKDALWALDATGKILWKSGPGVASWWDFDKRPCPVLVADLNGDKQPEIVSLGRDELGVYDNQGHLLWHAKGPAHPVGLALADVDGDKAPEIIVTGDSTCVFNAQGQIAWEFPHGAGLAVAAGDVDGDGAAEIAVGENGVRLLKLMP